MSIDQDPLSEFISFRVLTPDEILQSQNRQTVLTPREKFERIQKHLDKRTRRLRKYHFIAIETKDSIFIFDGEGEDIGQFANSVAGARLARNKCLDIFLSAANKHGGYMFSGPDYADLSEEELIAMQFAVRKEIEIYRRVKAEIAAEEEIFIAERAAKGIQVRVPKNAKLFCAECEFEYPTIEEKLLHVCTENWVMFHNEVVCKNYGMMNRKEREAREFR